MATFPVKKDSKNHKATLCVDRARFFIDEGGWIGDESDAKPIVILQIGISTKNTVRTIRRRN